MLLGNYPPTAAQKTGLFTTQRLDLGFLTTTIGNKIDSHKMYRTKMRVQKWYSVFACTERECAHRIYVHTATEHTKILLLWFNFLSLATFKHTITYIHTSFITPTRQHRII